MITLPGDIVLHWLDISAGALIFLSLLFGYFRGFTRELIAVIAWLAAAILTHYTYDFNAAWLAERLPGQSYIVTAIAIAVVFVVLVIVFSIIGSPLWRAMRRSDLWLIDRLLGMIVGAARGVLLVLLIWVAVAHFSHASTKIQWAQDSKFATMIDSNSRGLIGWVKGLPHEMIQRDWVNDWIDRVLRGMGNPLEQANQSPIIFPNSGTSPSSPSSTVIGN